MNWMSTPFIDYLNAVDAVLEQRYGVTSDDTGIHLIAACQEDGMEPKECAETIASKYELVEITGGK